MNNLSALNVSDQTFPLTREQEGLWIEWKLSPLGISYNTCIQMQLVGTLDVERFANAIADVVAQFQLLQAYCVELDDQPHFKLSPDRYALEIIDLSVADEPETQVLKNKAMGLLTRRRDAAIDLTQFPLIRSAIISTAKDTHYFIGVVPHIISDGYSAVFVLKAISIAYNQGRRGLIDAFGEAPDWQDYIARRNESAPEAAQRAVAHWQTALADAEHITPICQYLPGEASSVIDVEGKRFFFSLDGDKVLRFARIARSQKTSLFSILAALYAVFLYRQTGQEDLVIVFPVNMRPAGFRDAFGFYVNMVPLRVDMSGSPSFLEVVSQIGKRRREDKKHQHLPGLDIVKAKRESTPGFDGRLCNVSMAQTVSRFQGLDIPGVVSTALDNDLIHVRDDLSLMYEVSEQRVGLWLEYRESSFDDAEIRAMADRIQRIAEAADSHPDISIDEIGLLDDDAQRKLLALGCGPSLPVPIDNYADMFSATAAHYADETALVFADQKITYAELDRWSARIRNRILSLDGAVAILLPRCPGQIASMLAALRSGIPYIPLDPDQGKVRIERMLEQAQPSVVICDPDTRELLPQIWQEKSFSPELAQDLPAKSAEVSTSNPAYVIFTSGSTGQPKGVQIAHQALATRIAWLKENFPLKPGEPVLQNTNYAFDVSVAEILWPLASGARLIMSEPKAAQDPRYLARLIRENAVTTLCMVPSAWQMLLDAAEPQALESLQRILSAGEALSLALARQTLRQSNARLFNVYGPTEATIYATWKEVFSEDESITIGRAIGGAQTAVINSAGHIQPVGIEGELCLAGPGLAEGYLDEPELTAQKFPTTLLGGRRWYRTGDRARLTAKGEIEYLGRADAQIKLRGYRIELGEIEHVLRNQDGIADAAVLVVESSGHKQLLGFVQAVSAIDLAAIPVNHPLASDHWRNTLRTRLPTYMVPNTLTWLENIPRLASGKVDRTALARVAQQPQPGTLALPQTDEERAMAEVWASVLGLPVDAIGLHSNFFELGGDSLMLIALATQAEAIGIYIDVHELFEHATIAEALPLARRQPRALINQAPVAGNYAILPRHHKFFADEFEHPAHWNRTFVLKFKRHIDDVALTKSLGAALRHHDGLRVSFHHADGKHYFTNHGYEADLARLKVHDLTAIDPSDREAWVIAKLNEANASLDLQRPPLLQVMLFDDEKASTLGLVIHHLLIDMRSCYILLEDLLSGYQASVAHREIHLPAKTTSLAQWSERLHRLVDDQWYVGEVPYWRDQLAVVGHAMPGLTSAKGNSRDGQQMTLHTALSRTHTERLTRELNLELGMGVQGLLIATFAQVFKDWCHASHLVVNTCGIGREAVLDGINLTRTVGELNTVFPLAFDLGEPDILQMVRDTYAALPANGYRYGILRYIAKHPELQQREPDVFFNYVSRVDTSMQTTLGVDVEMAPQGVASSHPDNHACYALYLEALVQDGCLQLHIGFDQTRFSKHEIVQALAAWQGRLVDLVQAK